MSFDSSASEDARIDVAALLAAIVRRLPRILLVTLALLVLGFVVLMFQPRLYESTAAILVEPRANVYMRASNEQAATIPVGTPGVISSQIELLKSRNTLLNVIDELDLRSIPEFNGSASGFSPFGMLGQLAGRAVSTTPNSVDETVLAALHDRLSVVQERDSAIISVLVRSSDPQLAADIANAVASAHVARRAELSISDTAEASGWLLDEINRLRVSVQAAESAVADFRVNNDLYTGQNNTSLLDQQLSTIASQITTSQERRSNASSRAALIRGLIERGQPIESVADVRNSAIIQQLSQEKARLQGELAQRSATLLASHPTIRALNAQIGELNNQIRQEGQRVAAALDAEAQIEADLEASLQAELNRAKASASTATMDNVTLDSLQREAKAQRDLLEAYLLRYNEASSRVDATSALPDVRFVSVAAPSVIPASPKTSLIMIAIGFVSIAVQVGAVAFGELMSGRALAPVIRAERPQDELESVPFDESELEPEQRWEEPAAAADAQAPLEPEDTFVPDVEAVAIDDAGPEADPEPEVVPELEPVLEEKPGTVSDFIQNLMADAPPRIEDLPGDDVADEPEAENLAAMAEAAPVPLRRQSARLVPYSDLVSDLLLGRTHLLLLADQGEMHPSRVMAEELVADALGKGLSVALIDAGTGTRTDNAGITDLSTGHASFGDVVQKSADNSFAEVTWGRGEAITRSSNRPLVLTEALGDIYEVVVVLTGKVDRNSMLGVFSELGGRVILVTGNESDIETAEKTRQSLEEAGFPRVEIAALAELVAA